MGRSDGLREARVTARLILVATMPITIHARNPGLVKIIEGQHRPRVRILPATEEGGEVETSPPPPPTKPKRVHRPIRGNPKVMKRNSPKVVKLKTIAELYGAELSSEVSELAKGKPVELHVGQGEELDVEHLGRLIDAAEVGDHELQIHLHQQHMP